VTGAARLRARPRAWTWPAAFACLLLTLLPSPTHTALDAPAVADAIRIGRSSPADLERFHSAYFVAVDDPVVRRIEIVTPFRRVVQLTEERARLGDATWDQARAQAAARAVDGRLDLVLHLQFDPRNTYRTVPGYTLAIHTRGGPTLLPLDTRATASYLAGQPAPPGTPILGATVRSIFDQADVDATAPLLVGILLDEREVRRVALDLRGLR
jgi:hypothetical protein